MSLVFRNALMPSENQQVLRLRQTYLMRRFLLLALGMGFLLPTAANAEIAPYYLFLNVQNNQALVPMKSKAACERALNQAMDRNNYTVSKTAGRPLVLTTICLASE